MAKTIIIITVILVIIVLAYIGGRFNRRRVQRDNDSFNTIGTGINALKSTSDRIEEASDNIERHNSNARRGIGKAKDKEPTR
jgi:hypothetical protein